MSFLDAFALLRPWWFLAIPVVVLLALRAAWRSWSCFWRGGARGSGSGGCGTRVGPCGA